MTEFADDQSAIDKKRSKQATRRFLMDGVIRQLMNSQVGRLWIWEQLAACHLFENIAYFDGEGAIQKTYFAAGERNIGLKLLADVQRLCPKEYVLAMEENTKLEQDNGRRSRTGPDSDDGGDTTDESDPG